MRAHFYSGNQRTKRNHQRKYFTSNLMFSFFLCIPLMSESCVGKQTFSNSTKWKCAYRSRQWGEKSGTFTGGKFTSNFVFQIKGGLNGVGALSITYQFSNLMFLYITRATSLAMHDIGSWIEEGKESERRKLGKENVVQEYSFSR